MSKTKTNPNKLVVTKADMKKVEARWQTELAQMKLDATSNASLYVQCVAMLALKRRFNFSVDEAGLLIKEMDAIGDEIRDPNTDYDLDDVKKELEEINVFVSDEWR